MIFYFIEAFKCHVCEQIVIARQNLEYICTIHFSVPNYHLHVSSSIFFFCFIFMM